MSVSMVLFEHASGYALFRVKEFEEVSVLHEQVEASISDVSSFNGVVNLLAFLPFTSAVDALTNINAVSEGVPTEQLKHFVETNLPKKLKKFVLGVSDPKLGGSLSEQLGGSIKISHVGSVPEIIRGIRTHFSKLVKGLNEVNSSKAQLGLGHAYSRAKVKFNVNKSDNMIIQSIALLDQLDKDVNTFAMRMREWYSYHFPELIKIVSDNYLYAKCVKIIKNRKAMLEQTQEDGEEGILAKLEEVLMDTAKSKAVLEASRSSMGMDISVVDLLNIDMFASRVVALAEYRKMVSSYLQEKMSLVAPNLATLIGETVGARLISHAGSLTNLAKYPASTVQILGAEKALFRALKTRGNTPKYGLIFHSTFIGRAGTKNKGRISRYLANKCSIASRIDCFGDLSTKQFGEKLKEQVEDRLKFYETGDIPKKNVDAMREAIEAVRNEVETFTEVVKKKKKKNKKRKADEMDEEVVAPEEEEKPKKRKVTDSDDTNKVSENSKVEKTPKSGKKKKKSDGVTDQDVDSALKTPKSEKKSASETEAVDDPLEDASISKTPKSGKKKKEVINSENAVATPTAPKLEKDGDEEAATPLKTPGSETKKKKKKNKAKE